MSVKNDKKKEGVVMDKNKNEIIIYEDKDDLTRNNISLIIYLSRISSNIFL